MKNFAFIFHVSFSHDAQTKVKVYSNETYIQLMITASTATAEWTVHDEGVWGMIIQKKVVNFRLCVDSTRRGNGQAAAGMTMFSYNVEGERMLLHRAGKPLGILSSAFMTEEIGLEWDLESFQKFWIEYARCSG